jgi:hypothetical protein
MTCEAVVLKVFVNSSLKFYKVKLSVHRVGAMCQLKVGRITKEPIIERDILL